MKHPEERVALQAIEFWSTVCEEEVDLAIEAQEVRFFLPLSSQGFWYMLNFFQAAEYGEQPETESKYFAKIALPEIVPVLLLLLTKQVEDADEDEWNVSMGAATCLSLLAAAVQDAIVPNVIPFIEAHIKSEDWHNREAAIMTFGSILEGPDPNVLTPLVNQALPLLIGMMNDTNLHVKDTTAWTLGRICDLLIGTIKPDVHLHALISALVTGLQDNPRIAANCCWALMNLADQLGVYYEDDSEAVQTGPYYDGVVQEMLRVTERYIEMYTHYEGLSLILHSFAARATKPIIGPLHMKLSHLSFRKRQKMLHQSSTIPFLLLLHNGWLIC